MGLRYIATLALLLTACATPEERKRADLMNKLEAQMQLPKGAPPLDRYARYYAYKDNNTVVGVYMIPMNGPNPGDGCSEMLADMTSKAVPCPEMPNDDVPAGQRRWIENYRMLPSVHDGGCTIVNVTFRLSSLRVEHVTCNGLA